VVRVTPPCVGPDQRSHEPAGPFGAEERDIDTGLQCLARPTECIVERHSSTTVWLSNCRGKFGRTTAKGIGAPDDMMCGQPSRQSTGSRKVSRPIEIVLIKSRRKEGHQPFAVLCLDELGKTCRSDRVRALRVQIPLR
jgi:hypothetical protein